MLKYLHFSIALIAVIVTQISTSFLASPANAADMATLNSQLKQSVCTQNWEEAVKVIDQMIAITPSSAQTQHNELKKYRVRMQNLSVSRTNVDKWLESFCVTPVTNLTITTNNTITKALVSNGTTTDQQFIEAYKSLIIRRDKDPDIESYLLTDAQSNPSSLIDSAKLYCEALSSGLSVDEIQGAQAEGLVGASPQVKEIMIISIATRNFLAPKYYCPKFANR